ncbi:hypothetical protein [Vibrio gigantis]|uniref:hypothetical protein n=1 Tax=Vibrio gigantis TaxID=296199 RepID=UPI0035A5A4BE
MEEQLGTLEKNEKHISLISDILLLLIACSLVWELSYYLTGIKINVIKTFGVNLLSTEKWSALFGGWYGIGILVTLALYAYFKRLPGKALFKFGSRFWSSPACTSFLHFAVFSIGIYFSITSSQINNWLTDPIQLANRDIFSFAVTLLFLSIFIFVLNQRSLISTYEDKIDQLRELIRLAPPNGFASTLSNYVDVADDFVHTTMKNRSVINAATYYLSKTAPEKMGFIFDPKQKGITELNSKLDQTKISSERDTITKHIETLTEQSKDNARYIRALLAAYARLAALFDGVEPSKSQQNIYRANLMLKYSSIDKKVPEIKDFRYIPAVLLDEKNGTTHLRQNALSGYLTLHKELSVAIYTAKKSIVQKNLDGKKDTNQECEPVTFDPDPDVTDFSLPYFLMSSQKKYNCFGAPRAMAQGECQFINDTLAEIKHWKQESEPPKELLQEAEGHFSKHNRAKSVISIPLMTSRYSEEHKNNAMGVVNIYRDKTHLMMGNESKQKQFEHITTPLNYALARIVSQDIVSRYNANFLRALLESGNIDPQ